MENDDKNPFVLRKWLLSTLVALGIATIWIVIGAAAIRGFDGFPWVDCFYNSCSLISGNGAVVTLVSGGAKTFTCFYMIFNIPINLLIVGTFFSPVLEVFVTSVHTVLARFH